MKPGSLVAERFEIERLAGSGGMGRVYRALDRLSGGPVALKVLHGHAKEHAARLTREAAVLAELRHPGIVGYVAHGTTGEGDVYLAIEWLDGETLGQRLRREGLTIGETVALARRIAEALGTAHKDGIVHRDLKPANLFLVDRSIEKVKVLDFGIARITEGAGLTMTGMVIGTPCYMAPEQAQAARRIDARADVFALGCVLFHCLTGRPPFAGEEVHAALLKVVLEDAPRIRDLRSGVSPALDALVARMLSRVPDSRPADASAVAAELSAIEATGDSEAVPESQSHTSLTGKERRVVCLILTQTYAGVKRDPPTLGMTFDATMPAMSQPTLPMSLQTTEPQPEPKVPFGALEDLVDRFEGKLEVLLNGLVVVSLVGSGGAATDQAARAARCALSMRELLPHAPMALVAGCEVPAARLPMGEVIDRGVKYLSQGTPTHVPGTSAAVPPIRLDEVMAGLLDVRFDVGGDDVGLFLKSERDWVEAARTLLGRPTPFVGRDHELSILQTVLDECISEPVARAVLVTAAAGVGKSRLRYELIRQVQQSNVGAAIWMGQGDPMSAGSPFAMIVQALRGQAGLRGGEPKDVLRQRLRARIARHVSGAELPRIADFLGELAGVSMGEQEGVELQAARRDPILMGDQMRRAWLDLMAAESAVAPVLLVLEDLHWGDLPTVKLIDATLRDLADRPIFVLALSRPDIGEMFPKLWVDRGVQEIRLRELSRKGGEKLVRQVLGDSVSSEAVGRLVERAGGNAFYLEELIRAAAAGRSDMLPETVLAMVQARLDMLDPGARKVLRAASVFGQVFWRGGVVALLGGEKVASSQSDRLSELVEREIVTRRGEGRLAGQEEFAFRHALVREAAYAMLDESDRTLGHRLAGAWLEQAGERDAAVLAEHFERGEARAQAAVWYRRAAEQALESNDFRAAIARAERGIAGVAAALSLPTGKPPSASGDFNDLKGALRLVQAEAHRWLGEASDAERRSVEAMAAFAPGSPPWYAAAAVAASMRVRLGQQEALAALAAEITALGPSPLSGSAPAVSAVAHVAASLLHAGQHAAAEALIEQINQVAWPIAERDSTLAARIHALHASRALCGGDPAAALYFSEMSVPGFLQTGDRLNACVGQVNAANARIQLGAYAEAEQALRSTLQDARRMGLANVAALAKQNLGPALLEQGAVDDAYKLEREAVSDFVLQSNRRQEGRARIYLAAIQLQRGDPNAAEAEAQAALEALATTPPLRAYALAMWAKVLLAKGNAPSSLGVAGAAMEVLASLGGMEEGESLLRLVYAEALHAAGYADAARAAIVSARARLVHRASRMTDPIARAGFCERVPDNARTLALARAWAGT
jgi:serine/threonine protein kinase/tetratricopeptide (TPR) repeat protein